MEIARLRAGNEKCGKVSLLLNITLGPVISFCLCIASQSNNLFTFGVDEKRIVYLHQSAPPPPGPR